MKLIKFFIISLLSVVVCGLLLRSAYIEVKKSAIDQLNSRQLIMAEKTASGIESFFEHYSELLTQLAKMNDISSVNEQGRYLMQTLYRLHSDEIKGITRVSASGRIIYTFPEIPGAIGADLSSQKHIQAIMQTHQPVVSDIFDSIQGFVTIAFHVPVFENGVFEGYLAILIPFDKLTLNYLEPNQIGKDGYAWIINNEGVELYCPLPGHIGKSVFENYQNFPTILSVAREMVKGKRGTATYFFDRVRGDTIESVKRHAVYIPVHLGNTFWSMVVATPEDEVLDIIQGFRNRVLLIIGVLMLTTIVWTYYVFGAFKIEKEEEKRKQAEEALKESKQQLANIIDFLPDATLVINNEGEVIAWNKAIEEMTGVKASDMLGKGNYEYALPFYGERRPILIDLTLNPREEIWSEYTSTTRRASAIEGEAYMPALRGGKTYLAGTASVLHDSIGNIVGAVESIRDITERKQAEVALRESEEKFFLIFQHVPLMVAISTLEDGTYLDVNDKFMEVSGFTRGEVLGKTSIEVGWLQAEDRQRLIEALQRQGKFSGMEITSYAKDGRPIDCSYQCELVTIGGVKRLLTMVVDITDSKGAEEKRKKLEEQLFQAQKMESVGRLAGGVAHDFNNMLGVIIGRAELALDQEALSDKLQRNLKEILKTGLRSADLTRQLLAFARKQTAAPKILDLNDTISGVLKMLRRLIGEDIDLSWQPGLDLWKVKIDPSQIDQILANLVVNARDAISGVGAITLRAENVVIDDSDRAETPEFIPGEYVLLTVSDTGAGMSQEVRKNIFEPFFTTKEPGKGTGLGLSTVYGIVKQNDGFIYVASELGRGTTFKIYLLRFEAEIAQAHSEDAPGKPSTGTETILLVEDDEPILILSKMILENLGYTVLAVQTPAQAVRLAEEHPGDLHLLITDVVMPGMNGREMAEKISAIRPNLKCLYMSGYTADVIARGGILYEGVNFIQKPFVSYDLAAKVRQVLDHQE